jgi:hypothetical protein
MDPDPDSYADLDPSIFVIDLQDANKNYCFLVFLLITFSMYIYIIFKRPQKVKKKSESRFILLFLLGDRRIRIRIRIHTSDKWIRIRIL